MGSVRVLSLTEAAYIAGIVDGEGTVTLSRLHRNEQRRIVVPVSNNERSLLEYLQGAIGAGRITRKRTYAAQHAPSFTYYLTSRQALQVLHQIAPYLRTYKADRARMALSHYIAVTPRNGKYDAPLLLARAQFEEAFLAMRAAAPTVRRMDSADTVAEIGLLAGSQDTF